MAPKSRLTELLERREAICAGILAMDCARKRDVLREVQAEIETIMETLAVQMTTNEDEGKS